MQLAGQLVCVPSQRSAPHDGVPGVPAGSGAQVPMLPERLQASHPSEQEALQHTPLAQYPDEHCRSSVQLPADWADTHTRLELQK